MFGRKAKRIKDLEARCINLERQLEELGESYGRYAALSLAYLRAYAIATHDTYGFGDVRIQRILDAANKIIDYEKGLCVGTDHTKFMIYIADDMHDMLEDRGLELDFPTI